jgi:hypothetical protein
MTANDGEGKDEGKGNGEDKQSGEGDAQGVVESTEMSFEDMIGEEYAVDDEDENEYGGGLAGAMARAGQVIQEQREAITRAFVDYGPPYETHPKDEHILVNECSDHRGRIFEVHSLLNARVDPNLRDPEDLYYSASHWCARNCHFMILKMLHRANAKFTLLNEFGQTALHLACMVKQPVDKIGSQRKMVRFLLENGAEVNVRDRAGLCALDYCARIADAPLIKLLISHGADVIRDNNTMLVAPRSGLLDEVQDPDCYRLLYEAISAAKKKADEKAGKLRKEREDREIEEKIHARKEQQIVRRIHEMEEKEAAAGLAYQKKRAEDRTARIKQEMNTLKVNLLL